MAIVKINDNTSFGTEVLKVPFIEGAELTVACDISKGQRNEMRIILDSKKKESEGKMVENMLDKMIKTYIKDWNLADEDGKILPISYKTLEDKFSSRLNKWIIKKVTDFFKENTITLS